MEVHTCNLSTWEAETGNHKFKASLHYIARPISKNRARGTRVIAADQAWHSSSIAIEKTEPIQKAKLAKQAEKEDDMATCMKAVMEQGAKLSKKECNLLSVDYKNVVRGHRSAWRVISGIEQKTDTSDKKLQLIKDYQEKVESELRSICTTVPELSDKYLIVNATNPESKVFYLKMEIMSGILLK